MVRTRIVSTTTSTSSTTTTAHGLGCRDCFRLFPPRQALPQIATTHTVSLSDRSVAKDQKTVDEFKCVEVVIVLCFCLYIHVAKNRCTFTSLRSHFYRPNEHGSDNDGLSRNQLAQRRHALRPTHPRATRGKTRRRAAHSICPRRTVRNTRFKRMWLRREAQKTQRRQPQWRSCIASISENRWNGELDELCHCGFGIEAMASRLWHWGLWQWTFLFYL